jgi:hypothetical protein
MFSQIKNHHLREVLLILEAALLATKSWKVSSLPQLPIAQY